MPFTVVQISDIHLDPGDQEQCARLEKVRQAVLATKPDLVVASGDVSNDGFRCDGMFDQVKAQLHRFGPEVYVIPGNHDIGDKAGEKNEVQSEYVAKWKAVFGSDRFSVRRDHWTIVGINTQILGSGLHEEADQFEWLDHTLDDAERRGDRVAMFLHAAAYLFDPDEELSGPSQYWGFDPFPRRELLKRINRRHVKLIANGHLHWHQVFNRNGTLHVWCPSTSFMVDDAIFPRGGDVVGFVRYTFEQTHVHEQLEPLDLPAETILFYRRAIDLPGRTPIIMAELVLDFTGTLSKDGHLLPGIVDRLEQLAKRIRITVMTADTFGKANAALAGLPLDLHLVETGKDKRTYVNKLTKAGVVAIGNGRNDVEMMKAATLGIAVIGSEGANTQLLQHADVVVGDVRDALDLVANPLRLKATLRE